MQTVRIGLWTIVGLFLLSLFLLPSKVWAQAAPMRNLTRGLIWSSYRSNGIQGKTEGMTRSWARLWDAGLMYPGAPITEGDFEDHWGDAEDIDFADRSTHTSQGEGIYILTKDPDGVYNVSISNPRIVTEDIVPMTYDASVGPEVDLGVRTVSPATGAVTANYWPGAPPVVNDVTEIHNFGYDRYIPNDNQPEEILITQWATETGIVVTKKAKAWGYPDYDDFIIQEVIIENTGAKQLNDTYLSFLNFPRVSRAGHMWGGWTSGWEGVDGRVQDDWYKYSEASNFDGLPALQGKKIQYAYDGDYPFDQTDDTGEPARLTEAPANVRNSGLVVEGQIRAFQYIGLALLDADPTDGFTQDTETYVAPKDPDQPAFPFWWQLRSLDDIDTPEKPLTDEEIYLDMTGQGTRPVSPKKSQPNPTEVTCVGVAQTYGPYDLAPGDKAKVVVAWVAGSGAEFAGSGGTPMDILKWTVQPDAASQLADGERAMAQNLDRARFAYANDYDIPDAPPDIKFKVESDEDGNNALSWSAEAEDAEDPDYLGTAEAKDVVGYRIYRSGLTSMGPWDLVAEVPVGGPYPSGAAYDPTATWVSKLGTSAGRSGLYTYKDAASLAGFNYWYSLRSYDSGHADWNGTGIAIASLESGHGAPETRTHVPSKPIVIATEKKDRFEELVTVVPNPFKLDDVHRYPGGSEDIRFVNVPRKCKISIFTVSGDLIAVVDNPLRTRTANKGEATWTQVVQNFASKVATGKYLYVVESLVPESMGEKAYGTFMVIK